MSGDVAVLMVDNPLAMQQKSDIRKFDGPIGEPGLPRLAAAIDCSKSEWRRSTAASSSSACRKV